MPTFCLLRAPLLCSATLRQMINWLDLGRDTVPPWLANTITERWFFQGLMRRLRRYTAQHGLTADTPPEALQVQSRVKPWRAPPAS